MSPVIAALHGPPEEDPAAVAHADVGAVVAVLSGPAAHTHKFVQLHDSFANGVKSNKFKQTPSQLILTYCRTRRKGASKFPRRRRRSCCCCSCCSSSAAVGMRKKKEEEEEKRRRPRVSRSFEAFLPDTFASSELLN